MFFPATCGTVEVHAVPVCRSFHVRAGFNGRTTFFKLLQDRFHLFAHFFKSVLGDDAVMCGHPFTDRLRGTVNGAGAEALLHACIALVEIVGQSLRIRNNFLDFFLDRVA